MFAGKMYSHFSKQGLLINFDVMYNIFKSNLSDTLNSDNNLKFY